MSIDSSIITQLGILGFLGYFFIKEFFTYLKIKNNGNGKDIKNGKDINTRVALIEQSLQEIKDNHLHTIEKKLEENSQEHKENRELLIKIITKLNIK